MEMKCSRWVLAFVVLVLLGGEFAAPGQQADSHKHYVVSIKGFKFVPEKLEVNSGDTITWKNEDIVPHIVTGEKFKSKSLDEGDTWTYTAKQKGDFPYNCRFHPSMKGSVIVR
jgi:plastocyanin